MLNGYGLSETHCGGYAEYARVKGDWLVPLPKAFTAAQAMAIGTAGYTAMLACLALEDAGVTPDKGAVVVTGAAGGVGSVAVAVLAKLGFSRDRIDRPHGGRGLPEKPRRRGDHPACGAFRRSAGRSPRNVGRERSTASAPRRSPT